MKFIICPLLARALPKRIGSFVAESTQEATAIFIIYLLDAIRAIADKDRKPAVLKVVKIFCSIKG